MQEFSEKRDFYRMAINCDAQYRDVTSDVVGRAVVKDLSAGGLQLLTEEEVEIGSQLNVEVLPGKNITPPLHAVTKVIRSTPADGGGFIIACSIEKMLSAEEVGLDFL